MMKIPIGRLNLNETTTVYLDWYLTVDNLIGFIIQIKFIFVVAYKQAIFDLNIC